MGQQTVVLTELPNCENKGKLEGFPRRSPGARAAAEYFIEQGVRSFAAYCDDGSKEPEGETGSFASYVKAQGYACSMFYAASQSGKSEIEKQIRVVRWLGDLPKPIGVFAGARADLLLDICRLAGYSIPDEVIIVGRSSEHVHGKLKDGEHAGEAEVSAQAPAAEAAAHKALAPVAEERPEPRLPACKDKLVSDALDFIHNNACDGITVADVLNEIPLSRRVLEHRFRKAFGKTPHEEILSARLRRVKQLLAESDLTLTSIADLSGFKHTEYVSVAFKREVGLSPSQYRKLYRRRKLAASPESERYSYPPTNKITTN